MQRVQLRGRYLVVHWTRVGAVQPGCILANIRKGYASGMENVLEW